MVPGILYQEASSLSEVTMRNVPSITQTETYFYFFMWMTYSVMVKKRIYNGLLQDWRIASNVKMSNGLQRIIPSTILAWLLWWMMIGYIYQWRITLIECFQCSIWRIVPQQVHPSMVQYLTLNHLAKRRLSGVARLLAVVFGYPTLQGLMGSMHIPEYLNILQIRMLGCIKLPSIWLSTTVAQRIFACIKTEWRGVLSEWRGPPFLKCPLNSRFAHNLLFI